MENKEKENITRELTTNKGYSIEAVEEEKAQDSIKQPQIELQNRKQKRLMAKKQRRNQKLLEKRVMDYIRKHPEAIKFDIDEDKVKEVEAKENEENNE